MTDYPPAQQAAIDLLDAHGIDAKTVVASGFDEDGYNRIVFDERGFRKFEQTGEMDADGYPEFRLVTERVAWPEGFPYTEFAAHVKAAAL